MKLSETFYSIEGEGPYVGRPTYFVRSFGCNLTCQGFSNPRNDKIVYLVNERTNVGCDSAYSWHPEFKSSAYELEEHKLADMLVDQFEKGVMVSLTGGEPLLWQKSWEKVFKLIDFEKLKSKKILVETNGTVVVTKPFMESLVGADAEFSVSLKLSNSGEDRNKTIVNDAIKSICAYPHYFKFVTSGTDKEIEEIQHTISYIESLGIEICKCKIWLMPEGATVEQQNACARKVAQKAMEQYWSFTPRLHVYLFNNERGT